LIHNAFVSLQQLGVREQVIAEHNIKRCWIERIMRHLAAMAQRSKSEAQQKAGVLKSHRHEVLARVSYGYDIERQGQVGSPR
jgi:hypothetical protein